ncbi:MAG TPA: hypothetical protein VMF06_16885 [Candidatus Limnocylindria bacterium]|nr:hypothetical protein [Candidatus Limnocylindria bacterium]
MKAKLYIGVAVVLAASGGWGGRWAWRAYHDIVSLHVRDVPLAKVLRSLEWQSWETIVADSRLDTHLTLDFDDLPLTEALERVGEQAGAVSTLVHAVYNSGPGLQQLENAMRGGDAAKATSWTNVAPQLNEPPMGGMPGPMGDIAAGLGAPDAPGLDTGGEGPGGPGRRRIVMMSRDMVARSGGGGKPGSFEEGPPVMRVFQSGPDGAMKMEVIFPERVMMEKPLEKRLDSVESVTANLEGAVAAAQKSHGQVKTLYGLQKSDMGGMGMGAMHRLKLPDNRRIVKGAGPGPESGAAPEELGAHAEAEAQRANLGRFQKLTPEQRAQRSRDRQGPPGQP